MPDLPRVGTEAIIQGLAKFESDSKKVIKGFTDMDSAASKLGSVAGGLAGGLGSLGSSLLSLGVNAGKAVVTVAALGAGITAAFATSGVKAAIDLDQQVANIAATMGATRETAGTLKDELKGLALDLSLNPNLTVDVTQAGQAIEVLAANGALATDEFGKLTQASKDLTVQTVALANATGSDFATAATIATDASNLFGLEANEMGKAVDGAAGIMNASKFNANDYQLALANAGGIAAEMGINLEDFNTVLAGTASNFASGSDAGTSFKALLQRLANPTDEVKAAMEKYGISLFDANGQMRSMSDITQDLNQVFNGTVTLTSQVGGATKEQAKAAETASKNIGDLTRDIQENRDKLKLMTDVYQESLKFYDAGEPRMRSQALAIQRLTNDITDQEEKLGEYQAAITAVDGAQIKTITSTQQLTEAQRAELAATLGGADGARILLGLAGLTAEEFNTLSDSVNRSGQGLEAAALRVDTVKGAMDIFKGVIQAVQIQIGDKFLPLLKEMAVGFTDMAARSGPAVVAFFGQIADGIGAAITTISTGIGKISGAFERFGARGAAVSLLGQLGFSPEEIATITPTVDAIIGAVNQVFAAFEKFGARGAAFSIMGLLGISSDTMVTVNAVITGIIETLTNFASQVSTILSGISFTEIMGALTGIGALLAGGVLAAVVAGLMSLLTPINLLIAAAALLGAAWAGNWLNIQGVTQQAITTITNLFNQFVTVWNTNWPIIQAVALTAWEVIKGIFAGFTTALSPVLAQLQTNFGELQLSFQNLGATLNDLGINWQSVFQALLQATGIVAAGIGAAILGLIGVVAGLATGIAAGVSATIDMFQVLFTNVSGMINGLTTVFQGWVTVVTSLLQGDFAMAWEGFKTVLQGSFTFWTNMWAGMINGVLGAINVINKTLGGFVDGIIGFFQGLYNELVGNSIIPDLVNDIASWFKKMPQMIISGLSGLVSKITAPFKDAWEGIKKAINIDGWTQLGTDAIEGLLEGMKEKAGEVLEFLKSLAMDSLAGIGQFWGAQSPARKFIPLGESVPQGLGVGIEQAAPGFLNTVKGLGQSAIDTLMTGMRVTDTSFIHDFIDSLDMGGIGKAAGAGGGQWRNFRNILINEITAGMSGLESGTINFMDKITEVANRFQFPPNLAREFAQAEGLVEHLTSTFGTMFQKLRIENMAAAIGIANNFSSIGSSFADMVQKQIDAFEKSKAETISLGTENTKLTGTLVEQQTELAELQAELLKLSETETEDTEAKKKKQEQIAKLTAEINKNKLAIEANQKAMEAARQKLMDSAIGGFRTDATSSQKLEADLARIQLLQEFLAGSQNQLVVSSKLQTVYGEVLVEQTYDRAKAQAELNQLTAEQARREQEIIKQREAQAKLDFLGQQISLIKLISDRGLNPKDILGGITLGLQAGATDLLAATNKVVEAMVNQINQDLQIHSPSAVMARIGQQIMAGLQGGILSMTPALNAQLSASVAGPISPMMAGAMGRGGDTYNYNSYQLGGNNIYNQTDEAIFESRVLQVIRRNL